MLNDTQELLRIDDEEGTIVVSQCQNRRVMTFGTLYEQSAMYTSQPTSLAFEYTQAMLIAIAFRMPTHVTLLGLGGGSLLRNLHHHFVKMQFDVIELRKHVLDVARQYFFIPEDHRVQYIQEDALCILGVESSHSTDMIFSDMFNALGAESYQESTDFLQHAQHVLSVDGWLVINFHELPSITGTFMRQALDLFPEVYWVALNSGNYVMLLGKERLSIPYDEVVLRMFELEQQTGETIYSHARKLVKVIFCDQVHSVRLLKPILSDQSIVFQL